MVGGKESTRADNVKASAAFLTQFPQYIRVDISCRQISEDEPHELVEFLYDQIKQLSEHATQKIESFDATLWPSLFAVSSDDAKISKEAYQDRGCFLVGITGGDGNALKAELGEWEQKTRKQTLFVDYDPAPLFSIYLVRQEELGTLRVNEWMNPNALSAVPLRFATDIDGEESYEFLADTSPLVETVPAEPRGKLTPASEIVNRIKWDAKFDIADYIVVYEDRHDGMMEISVELWTRESTEEHFIPMHRVRSIKRRSTGQTVWHREERIDLIGGN
jgi:uncharacterized protein (UPF0248 family)